MPGWGKQCLPDRWSLRYGSCCWLWLCGVGRKEGTVAFAPPFCPSALALMPDTFPCVPLVPFKLYPGGAGTQREFVCVCLARAV